MKRGIVFIGWSGTNTLATKVEEKIESDKTYVCTVGGNHQPLGNTLYVGDTILSQLQKSNQAIFLIEKKKEGYISNNLMFEIGFALSKFNAESNRIHLFYIDIEENDPQIPSDLRGAWATYLHRHDKTDDELVDIIYAEFLKKQRYEIPENKMGLINTWYNINFEIKNHVLNPRYSDYEFAQYLLFYIQAANMFGVIDDAKKKIESLSREIKPQSTELYNTVTLCLTIADLFLNIKKNEGGLYLTDEAFMNLSERFNDSLDRTNKYHKDINPNKANEKILSELTRWTLAFTNEKYCYACKLYLNNLDLTPGDKTNVRDWLLKCKDDVEKYCNELITYNPATNIEVATLLKAYVYRNVATMYEESGLNNELRNEYYKKTLSERKNLLFYYKYPELDERIVRNFTMEYYLSIAEVTQLLTDSKKIRANVRGLNAYLKTERDESEQANYYFKRMNQMLEKTRKLHPEMDW